MKTEHLVENEKHIAGPIKEIIYGAGGFLVWSTLTNIYVKHLKRKTSVCRVERPAQRDGIPSSMYNSQAVKPIIILKEDRSFLNKFAEPNASVFIGWFNIIKKVKIEFNSSNGKFEANTVRSLSLDDSFICSMSFSLLQ